MKLTNVTNLPESIYQAIANDDYDSGGSDYTATQLISPPRIPELRRRHDAEIVEDARDRVWALLGKSVHAILEAAGSDNALHEERIFVEVLGRKISGATDRYHDNKIIDYKTTSAWTRVYGSRDEEWEQQLNIYGYLFRSIGFPVESLEIIALYRDWSANKAKAHSDYPQSMIEAIPIKLWDKGEQIKFIAQRVEALIKAESLPDDELPECSTEDMWEKPTVFAVMKQERKKAVKLFDDLQGAQSLVVDKGAKYYIEKRPGERTRCEEYCSVAPFCNQYADYSATK